MEVDREELRNGVAATLPFVLSHHRPSEYDRCYAPVVSGRRIHVCARCLGIYPGIAAGALAYVLGPWGAFALVPVAILPLPALVDWSLTAFTDRRGSNVSRTATGALLGVGYGLGLALLLVDTTLAVLGIGFAYAIVAAFLLRAAR